MKALVIGGGGREHSLVWKMARSKEIKEVLCAPGNAGISRIARCIPISPTDIHALADLAERERIDLTVVGPEAPLTMGIVDLFEKRGLRIFGPSKRAAEIEASKAFSKDLMKKYQIPTARYKTFTSRNDAIDYVLSEGAPICIKADGLAGGKGVFPCKDIDEAIMAINRIMVDRIFGDAGNRVVVEEYLTGEEASFLVFTDGESIIPMPSSQDHKPIFDGDKGPNTGGMGAYSPAPVVTGDVQRQVMEEIIIPILKAMAEEGRPYKGVLYAGLMIKDGKAKVLEFNARLGDPEAQPLLMRMKGDIVPVLNAVIDGSLSKIDCEWDERASVCVIMASMGYPGPYERGKVIYGLEDVKDEEDLVVFHAGTALIEGRIVTDGGRVLGVTSLGNDIKDAIDKAYRAVEKIHWEGVHYRRDIGRKALKI